MPTKYDAFSERKSDTNVVKPKVSRGAVALWLAVLGGVFRFIAVATHKDIHSMFEFIPTVSLLIWFPAVAVAGYVGLCAMIKNDGRAAGIFAFLLFAIIYGQWIYEMITFMKRGF